MLPVIEGVLCTIDQSIARLCLARPEKKNAFSEEMWLGLHTLIAALSVDPKVSVIVLEGDDQVFSSGMDTAFLLKLGTQLSQASDDEPRKRLGLLSLIDRLQDTVRTLAACPKPTIAVMNGMVMGAAMDLISACDIRLCSVSARFCVKEIDWAIPADLGVLYCLPRVMSASMAHEWIMTGRIASAEEATRGGLCSHMAESPESLRVYAEGLARSIAEKSPLAMTGIKRHLIYNTTASYTDSLRQIAQWNASFLSEQDIQSAGFAYMQGKKPSFKPL